MKRAVKKLPWPLAIFPIPVYALLSYGAYKAFWQSIVGRPQKDAEQNRKNSQ
jgi:hypothetical protein